VILGQPLSKGIQRFLSARDKDQIDAHQCKLFGIARASAFGCAGNNGPGSVLCRELPPVESGYFNLAHSKSFLSIVSGEKAPAIRFATT